MKCITITETHDALKPHSDNLQVLAHEDDVICTFQLNYTENQERVREKSNICVLLE